LSSDLVFKRRLNRISDPRMISCFTMRPAHSIYFFEFLLPSEWYLDGQYDFVFYIKAGSLNLFLLISTVPLMVNRRTNFQASSSTQRLKAK